MKKFGSIKVSVPPSLNFEGRNQPTITDSGKISKRKGKPALEVIPEEYDKSAEIIKQPTDGKWGTAKLGIPDHMSYRNKAVEAVKDGDLTLKNKEPSINLVMRGRSLEVLSQGEKNKVVEHFMEMLDRAPIHPDDIKNIKKDFIQSIMKKGIKEGLQNLRDIIKEIIIMDKEEATERNIKKGQVKLAKFKGKREAMIEKGREKFGDLKGMGSDDFRLVVPPNEREPMEDDAFFYNMF